MSDPDLQDIIDTHEQATPDHREHAKTPKHLNDGELEHRADQERAAVDADAPPTVDDEIA